MPESAPRSAPTGRGSKCGSLPTHVRLPRFSWYSFIPATDSAQSIQNVDPPNALAALIALRIASFASSYVAMLTSTRPVAVNDSSTQPVTLRSRR